jgi:hypothetical protein
MIKNNVMDKLGYRRVILDYHFSEYPIEVLSKADGNQIVDSMLEAKASALLMYTKDHWGNMYSKNAQGRKHKNVDYDLFKQVLEAGRSKGLVVYAYYTVCWDEHYARNYPEWCSRDSQGNIICNNGTNRWKSLCINSPYRDITFYQVEELVKNYDFPALFIDLVNYYYGSNSAPCFCSYCKKQWKAEYGYEMPEKLQGKEKLKYLKFRNKFVSDYLRVLKKVVERSGKDIAITHNFGVDFEYDDYVSKEAEPWGFDYYSGSITSKTFRSFGGDKSGELITARFNQFWDFTIKSENQLLWESATALAHNQAVLIIDQPNIDGTVEKSSVETIGKVFEKISMLEQYVTDSSPFCEVGVYYNLANQEMLNERSYYTQFEEEFYGACKMLTEMHLPFDVITDNRITEEFLSKLKVVIVPDVQFMNEKIINQFRNFVQAGGTLIYTYRSATRSLEETELNSETKSFGLIDIITEGNYNYNFTGKFGGLRQPYMRINNGCTYINPQSEAVVMSDLYTPAFDVGADKWVSHNVQPGRINNYPGIVSGVKGSGKYVYFAYKFFTEYLHQGLGDYLKAFKNLLYQYYTPGIEIEAPSAVEVNILQKGGKLNIVLTNCTVSRPAGDYRNGKSTYHNNMDEIIPIHDIRIKVNGESQIIGASSINKGALEVEGKNTVKLSKLELFDLVTIEIKKNK